MLNSHERGAQPSPQQDQRAAVARTALAQAEAREQAAATTLQAHARGQQGRKAAATRAEAAGESAEGGAGPEALALAAPPAWVQTWREDAVCGEEEAEAKAEYAAARGMGHADEVRGRTHATVENFKHRPFVCPDV